MKYLCRSYHVSCCYFAGICPVCQEEADVDTDDDINCHLATCGKPIHKKCAKKVNIFFASHSHIHIDACKQKTAIYMFIIFSIYICWTQFLHAHLFRVQYDVSDALQEVYWCPTCAPKNMEDANRVLAASASKSKKRTQAEIEKLMK